MMIANIPAICQHFKASCSSDYELELGQACEEALAEALRAIGFNAYRPRQQFLTSGDAADVSRYRLRGKHQRADEKAKSWHSPRLLRNYQLDLIVRLGKRRWHIEVKALQPGACDFWHVHFGCCEKYDEKLVKVDGIFLVDQGSGCVWVVPNDHSLWERRPTKGGRQYNSAGYDYAVQKHLLISLQDWINAVLQDKEAVIRTPIAL